METAREENKSKQQHTQMKIGQVDDSQLYMINTWYTYHSG